MSARERREKRGEATRRLQAAARRLDGCFRLTANGGTPHALFSLGPKRELLVVYMGGRQVYRAWVRPAGDPDRSRQELYGDVATEAELAKLLAAGREKFA